MKNFIKFFILLLPVLIFLNFLLVFSQEPVASLVKDEEKPETKEIPLAEIPQQSEKTLTAFQTIQNRILSASEIGNLETEFRLYIKSISRLKRDPRLSNLDKLSFKNITELQ